MKSTIKRTICTLLATALLAAMFIIPAGAVTGNGVDILFFKPANWNGNIKIHLWNAGSYDTAWPGVPMTNEGNGWYRYKNSDLGSCSIVINDGSGSQTEDLNVSGMVTVKDNHVMERSQKYIPVYFERPSDWGTDIRVYYYSDDADQVAIYGWPGAQMDRSTEYPNEYNYQIREMANARIIFTDGVHQYPAQNEPGIQVKAGENVRYYGYDPQNPVEIESCKFTYMEASAETVRVNEEFTVSIGERGLAFTRYIFSPDSGYQYVNAKMTEDGTIYTVKFTEAGEKTICTGYMAGYGGDNRRHDRDGGIDLHVTVI